MDETREGAAWIGGVGKRLLERKNGLGIQREGGRKGIGGTRASDLKNRRKESPWE